MSGGDAGITRREAAKLIAGAGLALGMSPVAALGAARGPDFGALKSRLAGALVERSAAAYEATRARMIWNAVKPDRRPDAIVHAASVNDVQEAVRFAGEHGLKVAVRGGGHNWCASSMRDGGIMLDVSALGGVEIDAAARRASVGPGSKNMELAEALEARGLAFPMGHCPTVPLSGYLLNGGFGWNSGVWGPACFSLASLEVVNARGDVVIASPQSHADLYWAARGAGPGFFGVVTRYHLTLHERPAAIMSATVMLSLRKPEAVGSWLDGVVAAIPPEVELSCVVAKAPPGLPESLAAPGETIAIIPLAAFSGSRERAETALAPALAPPADVAHTVIPAAPATFPSLLSEMGKIFVEGVRYAVDVNWCDISPGAALQRARAAIDLAPSPRSVVLLVFPPAPPRDAPPPDACFSMGSRAFFGAYGMWDRAEDDAPNRAWVRKTSQSMDDVTVGYYVGESDLTVAPERARRSFAPPNWERLAALRAVHDPRGVFHTFL